MSGETWSEKNSDKNKIIARRFRSDLWNSGDLALADEIIDRDCLVHARIPFTTDFTRGPEAMKQLLRFYHLTFSEIEMTVEDVVVEGDMAAVRWSARGRHTGDLFGVPATGREVITSGIDMLRIVDDRIVEGWVNWDALSLLEQIFVQHGHATGVADQDVNADFLALIERLVAS